MKNIVNVAYAESDDGRADTPTSQFGIPPKPLTVEELGQFKFQMARWLPGNLETVSFSRFAWIHCLRLGGGNLVVINYFWVKSFSNLFHRLPVIRITNLEGQANEKLALPVHQKVCYQTIPWSVS